MPTEDAVPLPDAVNGLCRFSRRWVRIGGCLLIVAALLPHGSASGADGGEGVGWRWPWEEPSIHPSSLWIAAFGAGALLLSNVLRNVWVPMLLFVLGLLASLWPAFQTYTTLGATLTSTDAENLVIASLGLLAPVGVASGCRPVRRRGDALPSGLLAGISGLALLALRRDEIAETFAAPLAHPWAADRGGVWTALHVACGALGALLLLPPAIGRRVVAPLTWVVWATFGWAVLAPLAHVVTLVVSPAPDLADVTSREGLRLWMGAVVEGAFHGGALLLCAGGLSAGLDEVSRLRAAMLGAPRADPARSA